MVRTQISFDPKQFKAAQAEAKRRGISLAELCRQGLARMLEPSTSTGKAHWQRFSGAIEGDASASTNEDIDVTVYGHAR